MTFLQCYYDWMEAGRLPEGGLCSSTPGKLRGTLKLFEPTGDDFRRIHLELLSSIYWGSGLSVIDDSEKRMWSFTHLRQTIILFCAAINGEL